MFRRRAVNEEPRTSPEPDRDGARLNGSASGERREGAKTAASVAGALVDYSLILLLVFGGCCSYVSKSFPRPLLYSYLSPTR